MNNFSKEGFKTPVEYFEMKNKKISKLEKLIQFFNTMRVFFAWIFFVALVFGLLMLAVLAVSFIFKISILKISLFLIFIGVIAIISNQFLLGCLTYTHRKIAKLHNRKIG